MFLLKEIKYKITSAFSDLDEGCIINAVLLLREANRGLVYHPYIRGECPSIEMCKYNQNEEVWESCGINDHTYINIEFTPKKFDQFLLGKNSKFKRKFFN